MLGNHTFHKVLLEMCVLEDGGVAIRCPHECGGHDGCQIVSCHQVFSTVVHHPVEVFPEILEEEVVGFGEELKSIGQHCVVHITRALHGTHCSCGDRRRLEFQVHILACIC